MDWEGYMLKFDGLRPYTPWTALGPEGRLGPDRESLREALEDFPFPPEMVLRLPVVVCEVYPNLDKVTEPPVEEG